MIFRKTVNRILIVMSFCGAIGWMGPGAYVSIGSAQEARTWTDSTGKHQTEAIFVKLEGDKVTLRKPGTDKTTTVPISRLSEADQVYVEDLLLDLEKEKEKEKEKSASANESATQSDGSDAAASANPQPANQTANRQRTVPNNVVNSVRGAAYRNATMQNLRQIALAIINYQTTRGHFPQAAITGRSGQPLLSWRVAILPMMEQQTLYRQFRLNEPWDSEHNKQLIDQMPKLFQSPGSSVSPGVTNYLAVTGEDTVLTTGRRPVRPTDIRDGTSKTIMIVEVDDTHAVPWTKPQDYEWDKRQPLQGLGHIWPSQFFAAFADGRVVRLNTDLGRDRLNGMVTRAGGETTQSNNRRRLGLPGIGR